jgi:two-component system response regulator CpxR
VTDTPTPMPRPPTRILIVEDHDDSRELLGEIFRTAGFVIAQTWTATDALALLRGRGIDAIITDYNLGAETETGCWMLAKAESEGLLDAVGAIIVYSALPYVTPPASLPRALSLQKPVDIDVLVGEIERLLEEARETTPP